MGVPLSESGSYDNIDESYRPARRDIKIGFSHTGDLGTLSVKAMDIRNGENGPTLEDYLIRYEHPVVGGYAFLQIKPSLHADDGTERMSFFPKVETDGPISDFYGEYHPENWTRQIPFVTVGSNINGTVAEWGHFPLYIGLTAPILRIGGKGIYSLDAYKARNPERLVDDSWIKLSSSSKVGDRRVPYPDPTPGRFDTYNGVQVKIEPYVFYKTPSVKYYARDGRNVVFPEQAVGVKVKVGEITERYTRNQGKLYNTGGGMEGEVSVYKSGERSVPLIGYFTLRDDMRNFGWWVIQSLVQEGEDQAEEIMKFLQKNIHIDVTRANSKEIRDLERL